MFDFEFLGYFTLVKNFDIVYWTKMQLFYNILVLYCYSRCRLRDLPVRDVQPADASDGAQSAVPDVLTARLLRGAARQGVPLRAPTQQTVHLQESTWRTQFR